MKDASGAHSLNASIDVLTRSFRPTHLDGAFTMLGRFLINTHYHLNSDFKMMGPVWSVINEHFWKMRNPHGSPENVKHNEIFVKKAFQDHYANIRRIVADSQQGGGPARQLLEFRVQQGWGPLCRFLEVSLPRDVDGRIPPFPDGNTKEELWETQKTFVIYTFEKFLLGFVLPCVVAGAALYMWRRT